MHPAVRQVVMGARPTDFQLTKLLMGFEGTNGSQTFVDESPAARTGVTVGTNAAISTAQFKFGTSSALFDGANDWIKYPAAEDLYLGRAPWTIDLWARPTAMTGVRTFINQAENFSAGASGSSWALWAFNGEPFFSFYDPAIDTWRDVNGGSLVANAVQTHVRVDRDWAGKIRLYNGGAMVASYAYSGEIRQVSTPLTIACTNDQGNDYAGHLDEVRLMKGRAACGADAGFTPPAAPYRRR